MSTLRNDAMNDWRIISVGVTADKKVTFIETFPATSITNVLLVEVYSNEVCVTSGGTAPLTFGAPIQVYVVPSTRINPAQPVI
jgi:hypothetical protein